jgi:hypothetical protein
LACFVLFLMQKWGKIASFWVKFLSGSISKEWRKTINMQSDNYNCSDLMVDLSKFKRGAPLPPAPEPGSGTDLPAPAPPMGAQATPPNRMAAPGNVPPGTSPPGPEPAAGRAPPGKLPPPDVVKPLKMPQTKPPSDASEHIDVHGSPPVFIKIDKYTDIVRNIGKLKSYALNLRDALDALADIEKELTTGISISHKALDDFNSIIALLDSKLLRASAIKDEIPDSADVDKYIKGIYEQMDRIKSELKSLDK